MEKSSKIECRLREWRLEHDLTLQDVADLWGRDISTVSRVERGLVQLRPLGQVELARRLGVRVRLLFPVESIA